MVLLFGSLRPSTKVHARLMSNIFHSVCPCLNTIGGRILNHFVGTKFVRLWPKPLDTVCFMSVLLFFLNQRMLREDEQSCEMKFGSWTYDGFQVDLKHMSQHDNSAANVLIDSAIDLSSFYERYIPSRNVSYRIYHLFFLSLNSQC